MKYGPRIGLPHTVWDILHFYLLNLTRLALGAVELWAWPEDECGGVGGRVRKYVHGSIENRDRFVFVLVGGFVLFCFIFVFLELVL